MLHLNKQIVIRMKLQKVIKTFLIVSVAAFYFAIMPRCSRTNQLMDYVIFAAKTVKNMYSVRFLVIRKFSAIISLYDFRSIAKEGDRTLYKVYC